MGVVEREAMNFDVLVVGAGPAGLATAARLRQLANAAGRDVSVCVVEKAAEVGGHILSGAVIEPGPLLELFPNAESEGAPLGVPVSSETFRFLTKSAAIPLWSPPNTRNRGNRIVGLGDIVRWMGKKTEELGAEVFPGFAAAEVLWDETGAVAGVVTGDMGRNRDGTPGPNFEPGVELRARWTVFAEGCRGSATQTAIERLRLREGRDEPSYGLGIKELWEIDPVRARPGRMTHTVGFPLGPRTYGGGWIYHLAGNLLSLGLVVGLDYDNPHLDPFQEFQRLKTHPSIRATLAGGRRVAWGARTLSEGGFQSIPKAAFPGGLLVGDSAGLVDIAKIKGSHTAIKSGVLAAEALFAHIQADGGPVVEAYESALRASWVWGELYRVRNIRPAFQCGLLPAIAYSGFEMVIARGRGPWTFHLPGSDRSRLRPASERPEIVYPKPDGKVVFDRPSSVHLSNTAHREGQPAHLVIRDLEVAIKVGLERFASPETRFCPAGVFEIVREADDSNPRLQLNSANCVHCKTCDVKEPSANILWTVPEGGGGPNYPSGM